MARFLEALFDAVYGAYNAALSALRLVDLLVSVVFAATCYVMGALLLVIAIVAVQGGTIYGVYLCLFPPESTSDFVQFVSSYRLLFAFAVFAAGEVVVVLLVFWLFCILLTFKFSYVFESDKIGRGDELYSPFGDDTTDADPLTF